MRKRITTFVVLLLAISLLIPAVPAAAAEAPFGPGAVQLTDGEMAEVEGEFSPWSLPPSLDGGTASYHHNPSSQWTLAGAVRHAIAGAISGVAGYYTQ